MTGRLSTIACQTRGIVGAAADPGSCDYAGQKPRCLVTIAQFSRELPGRISPCGLLPDRRCWREGSLLITTSALQN
jgi:hypothetical protein